MHEDLNSMKQHLTQNFYTNLSILKNPQKFFKN